MCLIAVAYCAHPIYRLVVAANRDEFHERPTAPATFWEDAPEVLAGRDLLGGGTWMGVTRGGRFAAVTNYRDPAHHRADAPTRGRLVSDFLRSRLSPDDYLAELSESGQRYNGFSLLFADEHQAYYYSNRAPQAQALGPGIYGLSNHLLDTPWPKVAGAKAALQECLAHEQVDADSLLALLDDRALVNDVALPDTGIGIVRERELSPIFINGGSYGTRASTALMLAEDGTARFVERSFDDQSRALSTAEYEFQWNQTGHASVFPAREETGQTI